MKQYNMEHREHNAEKSKLWAIKHPDRIKGYIRRYDEHVKSLCNIRGARRRSLKKNVISTLTKEQWEGIKKDFNNTCCYCGKEIQLAQEHFIPLSKGGEYTSNNILPSCKHCNSSKRDKDFKTWYPKYNFYSKKREVKILKYLNYKNNNQQLKMEA